VSIGADLGAGVGPGSAGQRGNGQRGNGQRGNGPGDRQGPSGTRLVVVRSVIGLGLAAAVVLLLRATGSLRSSDDALVVMGFDPERARLITALIAGAVAAALVALVAGHAAVSVAASLGAGAAVFGPVFLTETRSALDASGALGAFDPVGWGLSLLTLVVAAGIAGWAAATLTASTRRYTVQTGRLLVAGAAARRIPGRTLARAMSLVLGVVVLAATLPVFGDMVNFAPDVHMRRGAPTGPGLTGPGLAGPTSPSGSAGAGAGTATGTGGGSPIPSSAAGPSALPAGLVAGPLPGSLVTPGQLSAARPWASSAPSGTGQLSRLQLPGPWTGGVSSLTVVDVYTPPGYSSSSSRDPVVYEVPYGADSWNKGAGITTMLDSLIAGGALPPVIVVFASSWGGPYQDAECADSYDGREHFDTYMATELVHYVDAHYRTIASPAARALLGASQGGYCAAALWSHHPDVFGSAVSFSGYFQSGVVSAETQNAARPFGGNAAYEAAQSPLNVVSHLAPALAKASYVVLSADLHNAFFGPQLETFAKALAAVGVPMAILPAPLGHSWQTQRDQLPTVLEMLAGRMVQLGVFGHA
jgi:enterochelin esterase-like enzyme